jgi:hypothetical protein
VSEGIREDRLVREPSDLAAGSEDRFDLAVTDGGVEQQQAAVSPRGEYRPVRRRVGRLGAEGVPAAAREQRQLVGRRIGMFGPDGRLLVGDRRRRVK